MASEVLKEFGQAAQAEDLFGAPLQILKTNSLGGLPSHL
jgi:hypothetical protein